MANSIFRMMAPEQERVIEPSQQRILSLDFNSDPSYYLCHAFNNVMKMVGDNIVLTGLICDAEFDDTSITVNISSGQLIQNSTLLITSSSCPVKLANANLFSTTGRIVVFADWMYLYVQGNNFLNFGIDYIATGGSSANIWNTARYATILEIFEFTMSNNKITSVVKSTDNTILICDKIYYKYGYTPDFSSFGLNRYMKNFFNQFNDFIQTAVSSDNNATLIKQVLDNTLYLKSLKAGNNIKLTENTNNIEISTDTVHISETQPTTYTNNTIWIRRV